MDLIVPAGAPLHREQREGAAEPPQLPPNARPESSGIPFSSLDKGIRIAQKTESFPTEKGGPGDMPNHDLEKIHWRVRVGGSLPERGAASRGRDAG